MELFVFLAAVSHREAVIDVNGSVEGVDTFIYWKKSGNLVR